MRSEAQKPIDRRVMLAMGTAMLFILGLLYSWSVFVQPLESEFGWSRNQTSVTYTISVVCFQLGILINGAASKRLTGKLTALVGMLMIASGLCLCSLTRTLWWIYIFYGIFCGLGIGICHNAWLTLIFKWFADKSGFASGIALFGYGVGGLALGSLASAIIYSPIGWRLAFLFFGALILVVGVVAMRFYSPPPACAGQPGSARGNGRRSVDSVTMLRQPCFWAFFLWKGLLMSLGMAIIGQTAMISSDVCPSVSVSTLAVGLLSVGNGSGRPVIGAFSDRFGVPAAMLAISLLFTLFTGALFWAYTAGSIVIVILSLIVIGICYGGTVLMSSNFVNHVYGTGNFALNNGVSALASIPFVVSNALGISFVKTGTGSYGAFFALTMALGAITIVAAALLPNLIRRMDSKLDASKTGMKEPQLAAGR